jgi:hypothetical protein
MRQNKTGMEHFLDSISVVGATDLEDETMDVCAEVAARYNTPARELTVTLDSFLRSPDAAKHRQRLLAPWLPERQVVREAVSPEEACDMARDIARSWRKKVIELIPGRQFH